MLRRYFALPVLLIVSAFIFASCGSSSDSSGSGDEDQITEAIQAVTTGTSPADCAKFQTQTFMGQSTHAEGKEALKVCEEDAKEVKSNPKSVAVSKVEVDGIDATANVSFNGGGFDGQTVSIGLVKSGDQWKLNKVESFVKLDKAKLVEQFESVLSDPSSEVKKSAAACFVKAVEKDSQAKVEELVLSPSTEATSKLIESCS